MRKLLLFIIAFTFLQSCEKKPLVVPADVLTKDTMIAVLADVHLAEAMLQLQNLGRNDSTRAIAVGYYKTVYAKHNITQQQFDNSFRFYLKQPEILSVMYDSVITRLSAQNLHPLPR
jgi:hypothetical protein